MVRPPLSKPITIVNSTIQSLQLKDSLIAQGNLEDGSLRSSVGSAESVESTFTTPHVEVDSAIDLSSGIKTSPSVSLGSRAVFLSARDLANISRYWGELV